jgi:hypothetical protein
MILARFLREESIRRFVEAADRRQWSLLPECLDDFIDESNPVRMIDAFVDALDLAEMNFEGVEPAARTRGRAQCRGDVAAGSARFKSQDNCDETFVAGFWPRAGKASISPPIRARWSVIFSTSTAQARRVGHLLMR